MPRAAAIVVRKNVARIGRLLAGNFEKIR